MELTRKSIREQRESFCRRATVSLNLTMRK